MVYRWGRTRSRWLGLVTIHGEISGGETGEESGEGGDGELHGCGSFGNLGCVNGDDVEEETIGNEQPVLYVFELTMFFQAIGLVYLKVIVDVVHPQRRQ